MQTNVSINSKLQHPLGQDQGNQLAVSTAQTNTFLSTYLTDCPAHWVSTLQCILSVSLASSTPSLLSVWTSLLAPQANPLSSHLAADILNIITIARNYTGQCEGCDQFPSTPVQVV